MKKTTIITASPEYISGHIRYGHFELSLDDEQLEDFKGIPLSEQQQWIEEEGLLMIDDYYLNDYGEIVDIEIHEE